MSELSKGSGVSVTLNQNEVFAEKKVSPINTEGLSAMGRSAIAVFEEYVDQMRPGNVVPEAQAIRYQVGLYKAISATINKNNQDFNKTWSLLLKIFFDHRKEAFGERFIYRYMANITLNDEQRIAFRRLTDLMRQTAPIEGRGHVLKIYDLKRAIEKDITPDGRQRILNFYNQFLPR